MADLETELDRVFRDLADAAPHHRDLSAAVTARARRRRTGVGAASAALTGVIVAGGLWWTGHRPEQPATVSASACATSVAPRVVPEWARAGFTDPQPVIPYALGHRGDMVAILFGGQLHSPPDPTVNNKVLWVSRVGGGGTLHIHARLEGSDLTTDVDLPAGAGPSYVDMPRAGCWRMDLTWSGKHDTIDLPYVAPQPRPSN
jgi:hypothetical protein